MAKRAIRDMVAAGSSVTDILAAGFTVEDLAAAVKAKTEEGNRAAQQSLDYSTKQSPKVWADRKAWLLDGQAIHGELKDYFWPAVTALKADDQAEFSKQRDLLFKALRTFLGDPPEVTP